MTRRTQRGRSIRPAVLLLVAGLWSTACSKPNSSTYQGYVEGEYVRVASPLAGRLTTLHVQRGSRVAPGDPLFSLDDEDETAAQREAAARLQQAKEQLENLRKGSRVPELDTIRAQLAQAQAALQRSEAEWRRRQQLAEAGLVAQEALDEARTAYERDKAGVAEMTARLATARLGGRPDVIAAAEAEVAAAQAALAQAEWRLAQTAQRALQGGLVEETIYVQGEFVPAGSPVVSLLPPENVKVRFFVPETALSAVQIGQRLSVQCDGCKPGLAARVTFISRQAEYTPPVIYSRETRGKLVFLAEARPELAEGAALHPGQPVEVRLHSP